MNKKKIRQIIREEISRLNESNWNVTSKSARQKAEIEYDLRTKNNALYASHLGGLVQVVLYKSDDMNIIKIYTGKRSKPDLYKSYTSPEQANKWVQVKIKRESDHLEWKKAEREKDAAKKAENIAGIKIGDIYYTSWGYDQTNLDFYKVLRRVGKASVEVIKIGSKLDKATSSMAGRYKPDPTKEFGSPMKVRVTRSGLKIGRQTAWVTDVNSSHYASSYH